MAQSTPRRGSSFGDPVSLFLADHFIEVMVVDHVRLIILKTILDHGEGQLSHDKTDVLLTPDGEAALPYMTSWRDRFTRGGRLHRRIAKSLVREWRKNGRLRFTVLPPNMRENFPGLFELATPPE